MRSLSYSASAHERSQNAVRTGALGRVNAEWGVDGPPRRQKIERLLVPSKSSTFMLPEVDEKLRAGRVWVAVRLNRSGQTTVDAVGGQWRWGWGWGWAVHD